MYDPDSVKNHLHMEISYVIAPYANEEFPERLETTSAIINTIVTNNNFTNCKTVVKRSQTVTINETF